MTTIEEYEKLISANSRITIAGFGIPKQNCPSYMYKVLLEVAHEDLRHYYESFETCCVWIFEKGRLKSGSYARNLKIDVETWAWRNPRVRPRIPLGVFILAAMYMGYRVRQIRGTTDARIFGYSNLALAAAA